MDGWVGNCVFLEDPVYGWLGGQLCIPGEPSIWMGWLGTLCVFLEDPVYGWLNGDLSIPGGPSVQMVW